MQYETPTSTNASAPGETTDSRRFRDPSTAYVFAPQKGLLSLLEHEGGLQSELQMDTLYLPSSSACFQLQWVGESDFWTELRDAFIGYDTILMNHLIKHYGPRGHFYHEGSKTTVDLTYGVFNPDEASKSVRDDTDGLDLTEC
jgi:hypothetical protein